METQQLESFTEGENPFWRDSISVGFRLGDFLAASTNGDKLKEYYIMANPFSEHDFYIVHQPTGKRIGVTA